MSETKEKKSNAEQYPYRVPTPFMVNLTRARESRGFTIADLAIILGIRTQTLRMMEAGFENRMHASTWKKLCVWLNYYDIYAFLTRELVFVRVPRPTLQEEFNHFDL